MFARKIDEGNRGEDIATQYLIEKGYKIIARNFRIRGGEIDIIAIDPSTGSGLNSTLVFIEVKTRTSLQYGTGLESITHWKLKALVKSAEFYKLQHKNLPDLMRIDAVVVMLDRFNDVDSIELVKNIS
ncbi:MAG TPA: YraN family protein [Candidatus Limnocylindrales bacterium]|nr:YraN family protein [Candidatus Limnocylindrales bacterium]